MNRCDPSRQEDNHSVEECYRSLRKEMIAKQIIARGINNRRLNSALLNVPRHLFVDERYRSRAYFDEPIPIESRQTMSQPYVTSLMIDLAELNRDSKLLEIGTGSGYCTALLANIVSEVYTIEIREDLYQSAKLILKQMGFENINLKVGDGRYGWKENAPYDAIIVTAAPKVIPSELKEQLKVGGRLIIPVGGGDQKLCRFTKHENGVEEEQHGAVRFVPLVGGESI